MLIMLDMINYSGNYMAKECFRLLFVLSTASHAGSGLQAYMLTGNSASEFSYTPCVEVLNINKQSNHINGKEV